MALPEAADLPSGGYERRNSTHRGSHYLCSRSRSSLRPSTFWYCTPSYKEDRRSADEEGSHSPFSVEEKQLHFSGATEDCGSAAATTDCWPLHGDWLGQGAVQGGSPYFTVIWTSSVASGWYSFHSVLLRLRELQKPYTRSLWKVHDWAPCYCLHTLLHRQ